MKIGSIVVCMPADVQPGLHIDWQPIQDEKTPYMIREVVTLLGNLSPTHVLFEEGIIGHGTDGSELAFPISRTREILPPEDISEEVEDMMCVPLVKSFEKALGAAEEFFKKP